MELVRDGGRFQQPHCSLDVLKPAERRQESGGRDHHGKETWVGTSPLQGQLFGVLRLRGWSCDRMITVSCVAISLSPNYVAFITDSSWNLICESHINSILSVLN